MRKLESEEGMERYGSLTREEFGARCRAARAYAGATLDELAPKMGITRQALSRRESGEVEIRLGERLAMVRALSTITGWREEAFLEEAAWPLIQDKDEPAESGEPRQEIREATGIEDFGMLAQEDFIARCRAARAFSGLTLEDLSELMGVSSQALSRRENGWVAISIPDRFVMAKVYCDVTGWPEEAFIERSYFEVVEGGD